VIRARLVAGGLVVGALGLASSAVMAADPAPREAVREFESPVLTFPTGIAVAADGGVWIASTYADQLVRFDPAARAVRTIQLPQRSHPAGLLADARGAVWYAASGLGLVARIEPDGKTVRELAIPSMATARYAIPSPWSLAADPAGGQVWFTVHSDGIVARVGAEALPVRRGFVVTEIPLGGPEVRPDGVAVDARGVAWVAELGADRLARVDPHGSVSRLPLPAGSRPRGVAAAPDGAIWVTLFGRHEIVRVDPVSLATRAWPMPGARSSNPDAVVVDRSGAVWVSEFTANTITRFETARERFTVFPLPTARSGVRALAVDGQGRVWFVGSYSGRLGVIEPPEAPR
jgi:virginiamycin B lyase